MKNEILHAAKCAFEAWLKSPSVSDNTEFIDGFFAGAEYTGRDKCSNCTYLLSRLDDSVPLSDYLTIVTKLQTAAKALEHYSKLRPMVETISCPIVVDVTKQAREALEKLR